MIDQFFTTPRLAARIVQWAGITPGFRGLEPSAGDGAFVNALMDGVPDVRVTAVEIDKVQARKISKRYEGNSRVQVIVKDFLAMKPDGRDDFPFDFAITNPPYGSRGEGYPVAYDAMHVAHAFKFCPRVIALLASGFENGIKRNKILFSTHTVTRRVVLVNRPKYYGPGDKGHTAKRDYVILDMQRKVSLEETSPTLVATERWIVEGEDDEESDA